MLTAGHVVPAILVRFPAGTKVVDASVVPHRSRLGEYIYGSVLIKKWHWDWLIPYLGYRHCIIPEGAEEIGINAFCNSGIRDDLRSVRIPGSVKKIGDNSYSKRACACYNTALSFYMLGDQNLATKWLDRADGYASLEYSPELRQRINARK